MYQKLILIGFLGRDPEMRFTADGKPITSFTVAANRKYKDKEETTWFRITVFERQAESCNQYLKKGSKVLVEGRLNPDSNGGPRVYQKKDGGWAASYEVVAQEVRFLDSKRSEDGGFEEDTPGDEDVPF